MDKPVELVVFDIAGTTVKDNGEIAKAFQQAMREHSYKIPIEKINPLMGYKKTEAIKKMLNEYEADKVKITDDYIDKIHERFVALMVEYYNTTDELQPLPNVKDVFIYLKEKNIKIGLDTGFPNEITDVIIERLGWLKNNFINYVVSSNQVPAGRPQPYMIQKMMEQAGITDAKKVIKIGDTETDINEGLNAGCLYSIGITTGAFTKEALEPYKPSFIFNDMKELIDLFENNKLF